MKPIQNVEEFSTLFKILVLSTLNKKTDFISIASVIYYLMKKSKIKINAFTERKGNVDEIRTMEIACMIFDTYNEEYDKFINFLNSQDRETAIKRSKKKFGEKTFKDGIKEFTFTEENYLPEIIFLAIFIERLLKNIYEN